MASPSEDYSRTKFVQQIFAWFFTHNLFNKSLHGFSPRICSTNLCNGFSHLANRVSNRVSRSNIPRPPFAMGWVHVCYLTLVLLLTIILPQIKFQTMHFNWSHICGLGFYHVVELSH